MADDLTAPQPDDGLVAMLARNTWANPLANSPHPDGIVRPGDILRVDPFYAQDIRLAGLADPVSTDELSAAVTKAGPRPHGAGIRITRSKA